MADALTVAQVRALTRQAEGAAVKQAARCLLCLRNSSMKTSQLKNFLEAAIACTDTRSVETWVLYQMGRHNEWRDAANQGEMFGHRVVACFDKSNSPLRLAIPDPNHQGDYGSALLELIRIFAGQLSRLHSYTSRDGDWGHIEFLAGVKSS